MSVIVNKRWFGPS